jgi:ParB family chromosome partitioning protein
MSKKSALGRGLSALIETEEVSTSGSLSMSEIEIVNIEVNPNQPRTVFDEESLEELAASIKQLGVIQPITLRKVSDNKFQIISGERRFRASKKAGLASIPAYVKEVADDAAVEMMALIENIQREDLNALEIALSFQKLIEEYKLTQDQLSDKVGKKRATVSNYLRLLRLPAAIQMALKNKQLDMGHARALIAINEPETQLSVYNQLINESLSVRKVEELVRSINAGKGIVEAKAGSATAPRKPAQQEDFEVLEKKLSSFFHTQVQFSANKKGKGKISIPFSNEEDLERIIEIFDSLSDK